MKRLSYLSLMGMLLAVVSSAECGTKEELIRLQNDVLALQNQIRMLEKSFTDQTQSLKNTVLQLNEQLAKSNQILTRLAADLESQSAGDKSGYQVVLQEIRNLGVKADDTSTRISALAQQVAEMKLQSKAITQRTFQSAGADPNQLALSADAIFNEAFSDLVQGKLDLAIEGFTAFLKNFPSSEKADDAQYYVGEAYYNASKFPEAVAAFTRVLNDYPSGDKVASACFKRGKAELAIQEQENAITDFKTIVQKYPTVPEANLAKIELEKLGVDLTKQPKSDSGRRRPRGLQI